MKNIPTFLKLHLYQMDKYVGICTCYRWHCNILVLDPVYCLVWNFLHVEAL